MNSLLAIATLAAGFNSVGWAVRDPRPATRWHDQHLDPSAQHGLETIEDETRELETSVSA